MKTKVPLLFIVLASLWGMKRYYADARADDLRWILGPTARLVSATTGAAFTPEAGVGYVSRERRFLIEKACAGVNFLIAAFAMLVFVLHRRVTSWLTGAGVVSFSLLASYAAAVATNAARITIALWLAAHPQAFSGVGAAQVHRMEGIMVYFGGLVLLYELALRIDRRTTWLGARS